MPSYSEKTVVPQTAEQIFTLVKDIEKYPEFLPWCVGLRIKRTEMRGDLECPVADLLVAFKGFRGKYTSRVVADPKIMRIDIEYVEGPFSRLDNVWIFHENPDGGCTIDFHIDFDFKSRVLRKMIGAVFGHAVRKMVGAFIQRGQEVYGTPVSQPDNKNPDSEIIDWQVVSDLF